ncbi:hypothetical protein K7X08_003796 [Anisodus acutangulus]|uniref:Uncharacterized protein n=1 Tax=Anisodus acutangulus TaxID=402998 RepID=A0A9Q1RGU9_9SOLA|nr:hypothetical protein K7X08_003796 [Anisodus acutangulus]
MTRKSDNYVGKVPNDSTVYAAKGAENLNTHARKKINVYTRKRIQKKDANVSNCDLKNLHLSQVDDTLNKKLPSAVDVILSSKSADTNQEKLVSKDLSRSNSPMSVQERVIAQGSRTSGAHLNCTPQSNDAVGPAGKIAGIKSLGSAAVSHSGNNTPKSRYQKKNVEPASGSWTSNNITEDQPASKSQSPISSSVNVVIDAGQNIENIKVLPGVLEEDCKNAASSKLLIPGDKARTFCGFENDFRSLCRAVNEALKAQLAVEAIEICKGYPVAEFEKLLYCASPVICPSVNSRTCQACVHGQGAPLCRHEIPNISLGNLWKWYEKEGSYGLEVKAEEHRSCKQCGIDCLKFSAYFVPFLSAIQLFKSKDNGTVGSIDVVDSGTNKISESSPVVDFHTIFSTLVPQPRVKDSSSLQKKNVVSGSRSSSHCSDTDLHHPPVESKLSDDIVELLFEYFEREQPQSRKHFFEKIQELVAGDGRSSYGDPSILQSTRLPDLHPRSWFSVAWYPIYRIPSGNFRAAFLTYHSLGHYVQRGQALDACIVSPVVGLQSYNAQLRHSMDHLKDVTSDSDPPSVLQDRLKTLEQTASLMSRAVRTNGSERLVNRHQDYEFFLSRRHKLP